MGLSIGTHHRRYQYTPWAKEAVCPFQELEEFPGGLGVKGSALSLLWLSFDPWLQNFHMLCVWPEKKIKVGESAGPRSPLWAGGEMDGSI